MKNHGSTARTGEREQRGGGGRRKRAKCRKKRHTRPHARARSACTQTLYRTCANEIPHAQLSVGIIDLRKGKGPFFRDLGGVIYVGRLCGSLFFNTTNKIHSVGDKIKRPSAPPAQSSHSCGKRLRVLVVRYLLAPRRGERAPPSSAPLRTKSWLHGPDESRVLFVGTRQ